MEIAIVGMGRAVEERGVRIGEGSHYHRHDGTVVAPIVTADSHGWNAVFGMHGTRTRGSARARENRDSLIFAFMLTVRSGERRTRAL